MTDTATTPGPATIRVVLIEDQRTLRDGLRALLDLTPDTTVAGSFRTMEEALRAISSDKVDLVLTDIGLPQMDGIEGTRLLRERFPALPRAVLPEPSGRP